MWSSIISVVTLLVNAVLTVYNSIMTRETNIFIENERQRHAHDLQSESYFKQKGAEEQKELLNEWTKFMTNMKEMTEKYSLHNPNGVKELEELVHDTFMYGSEKTCILLALYSKYNHDSNSLENTKNNNKVSRKDAEREQQKMVVYFAFIIASLKYDFTDEDIDPLLILQIQITDYDHYAKMYKSLANEIQEEIKNN